MRPEVLLYALNWLVANNELYKTITTDIDKLDRNLNVGYQGKSGPGKIHKVILVYLGTRS